MIKNGKKDVKQSTKTILVWGILILFMVMFYQTMNSQNRQVEEINFTGTIKI